MENNISSKEARVWLKDKFNLTFLLVLLISIIIRVYYFFMTKTQPLWYDESDYMSTALHWATGLPYYLNPQRPPLLPLLEFLLMRLGSGEVLIRFLLIILPSVLVVLLTYLIGKEMYNKKIGLIASVIMAVFWEVLFNSMRLHVEVPLLFFTYLSVYFFWKGYVKNEKRIYIWFFGLVLVLAFLTKYTTFLVGFAFLIFLIITERTKFLKNKNLWIAGLLFLIILIPYFIWGYTSFNKVFPFLTASGKGDVGRPLSESSKEVFGYIPFFLGWTFLIFFLIGLISLLIELILGFDLLLKKENKKIESDFFNLVFISMFLFYFAFLMRGAEDRWVLPIALALILVTSKGLLILYGFIKKYNKHIAVVVTIILLVWGSYGELNTADSIIKIKKDSYQQVKDAALWMKENSNPSDKIFSISTPQTFYYSERETLGYAEDREHNFINDTGHFEKFLFEEKPKYLTISVFEYLPPWIIPYINEHKDMFKPLQGYFTQDQKPLLIIYGINYK